MRLWMSISKTTPANILPSGAVQRTEPEKSDVSVSGNSSLMNCAFCPSPANSTIAVSNTSPPCIKWQVIVMASVSRFRTAAPVLIPPSFRRAGKRASLTGWAAPTPATPTALLSKRRNPPMYPSATTLTDPLVNPPRPCVEIVRAARGGIPAVTAKAPSAVSSKSPVTSTNESAEIGFPFEL